MTYQNIIELLQKILNTNDQVTLEQSIKQVNQIYESYLKDSNTESNKIRGVQIEIVRILQLIKIDISYLKASKNNQTIEQRITAIHEKIKLLLKYCEVVIELLNQNHQP